MNNAIIKRLYSIKDLKACTFAPPVVIENDAVAVRSFGDLIAQDKGVYAAHPGDFAICYVGDFDMASGSLSPLNAGIVMLACGSDFVTK